MYIDRVVCRDDHDILVVLLSCCEDKLFLVDSHGRILSVRGQTNEGRMIKITINRACSANKSAFVSRLRLRTNAESTSVIEEPINCH